MMMESAVPPATRRLGPPIAEVASGSRLDEYLADRFPFLSRSSWQKEISSGVVFINEIATTKPARRLRLGDELSRLSPIDEEPEVDTNLKLLWTDGDVAALYKPAGLPMHESGRYRLKTVAVLQAQILGPEWSYVHRLDRETSGLLICGRTTAIRQSLVEDWQQSRVKKAYLAITRSIPTQTQWTVDLPIKHVRKDRRNRAFTAADGDRAVTEFSLISAGMNSALVEARPLTGRTNQIRLHCEAAGVPLLGDKIYGADPEIFEWYRKEGNTSRVQKRAGFSRHALHAWKLTLTHPLSRKELTLECPLADDLRDYCKNHGIKTNI